MASNKVYIELDANGKRLLAELSKSEAKVKKLEEAGKKGSKEVAKAKEEVKKLKQQLQRADQTADRFGRSGSRAGRSAGAAFGDAAKQTMMFVGALVGVNGVQAAVGKVIELAQRAYDNIRRLRKEALEQQVSEADAMGRFLANNPQVTDKQAKQLFATARQASEIMGGQNAYQRSLAALTDVRSGTPGASEDLQGAALQEAAKIVRLDPNAPMAETAVGVVKVAQELAKELGMNLKTDFKEAAQMAANTVSMYGAVAGGDVSSLVGEIGRLRGLTKLSGNSMSDVLALHGFLTGELGVAGEQATTTESNLLARMATRDITVGEGKQAKTITLKADNSLDRFVELLQRIQQGEFGKTREDMAKAIASVTGSLGRESASALLAITAMGAAPERLSRARRMVNEGMSAKGSLTQQSLDRAKRLAPSVEITRKQRKGQRQKDEAGQRDVQGAMRENAAQRLVNMKEAYEVIDPLEDPEAKTTAIRDVVSQMRGESPLEYERRERLRLMKSMFGGTDLPRQHGVRHAYTVQGVQLAALQQGTVQAEGGLSRREGTLLAESGISNEAVQKLSDQGAKATTKAQREAFAEAVSAAVQQAIRNLEQRPNPEANLAAWRKAVDKVIAFSQEIQSGTDQRTVEAWGKQGIAEEQNPEQWAREQQVMLFRDVVRERAMNPRTRARQKEVLGQYGNVVEAGDQRDIARAKTAQDVGLAAFRAGTVDLSDGMDKIERAVLSAMGASEQRLAEIEQRLAEGQTKAVQEAVAKLVEALQARQNAVPQAPRSQEVD